VRNQTTQRKKKKMSGMRGVEVHFICSIVKKDGVIYLKFLHFVLYSILENDVLVRGQHAKTVPSRRFENSCCIITHPIQIFGHSSFNIFNTK